MLPDCKSHSVIQMTTLSVVYINEMQSKLNSRTNFSNHLTNSKEQSPSWDNSRSSASQEIPRHIMEPKVSLLHH
jgi:hypothetical protein